MNSAEQSRLAGQGPANSWRPIVYLSIVVLALAGFAGWMMMEENASTVPGFVTAGDHEAVTVDDGMRERVAVIGIRGQGRGVELRRDGDTWRLASHGGYPVPADRVNGLLDSLEKLRVAYVSEQQPPPYEAMGLSKLDDPAGVTSQVTLRDAEGTTLATLAVGTSVSAPGTTLQPMTAVARPDEQNIWLVHGEFQLATEPVAWVDNQITDIPPQRLATLAVTAPDGKRLALRRGGEGGELAVVEGLPQGERIKATWLPRELAGALEDLRFLDVRPAEKIEFERGAWKAEIATADGLTYEAMLIREADAGATGAWATLRAEANEEHTKAAAQDFNERHARWAYLLNEYAAGRLTVRPEDLTQAE